MRLLSTGCRVRSRKSLWMKVCSRAGRSFSFTGGSPVVNPTTARRVDNLEARVRASPVVVATISRTNRFHENITIDHARKNSSGLGDPGAVIRPEPEFIVSTSRRLSECRVRSR